MGDKQYAAGVAFGYFCERPDRFTSRSAKMGSELLNSQRAFPWISLRCSYCK